MKKKDRGVFHLHYVSCLRLHVISKCLVELFYLAVLREATCKIVSRYQG